MSDRLYNEVTLSTIIGNEKYLENTVKAILFSMKMCKFKYIQILSCIDISIPGIKIIKIPPMSYNDYSHFMIKSYNDYIDTKYVLHIHDDGFIINPSSWTDEFLEYDYIGALWDYDQEPYRCGNGGFTLRSKKLLEICQKYCTPGHPEDLFICRYNRELLDSYNIKFPNYNIAAKFAIESHHVKEVQGQNHENYATLKSFGFHAKASHACRLLDLINININEIII